MKNLFVIFAMLACMSAYCQTDAQIDSLCVKMCTTIKETNGADTLRINTATREHLPAFFDRFEAADEAEFDAMLEKIYFHLQKNCTVFTSMLDVVEGNLGEWQILKEIPKNTLNKKSCRDLDKIKKFFYHEVDGAVTNVTIDKGIWLEEFADGTFSKLEFKWTADCEFDLIFIESNNNIRKNLSSKGDKYHYGLHEKKDNAYFMWIVNNDGTIMSSPIHVKK